MVRVDVAFSGAHDAHALRRALALQRHRRHGIAALPRPAAQAPWFCRARSTPLHSGGVVLRY